MHYATIKKNDITNVKEKCEEKSFLHGKAAVRVR